MSIIVPVFNTGDTLISTVESILSQTYNNIETILVNDGSTDQGTLDQLGGLVGQVAVINQQNRGLPAARNVGVRASRGKYVICLDSDDCIDKKYVERIVKAFIKSDDDNLAVVSTLVQAFGVSHEQWSVPDYDPAKLKYSNVLPVASAFTKAAWEKSGGYDESFKKGFEDWDFWISVVEKGYHWKVIKTPLFYYRRKANSMITSANKSRDEICRIIINKHRSFYGSENEAEILAKMQAAEKNNSKKRSVVSKARKVFSPNFYRRFGGPR